MCKTNDSAFTTIKSTSEKFKVSVGRPDNAKVNLFFNFNVFAYMGFVGEVEKLPYLKADHIEDYEDKTSGMAIELTKENSLSLFIEDLPKILEIHVEQTEPTDILRKGTKESSPAESEVQNEYC